MPVLDRAQAVAKWLFLEPWAVWAGVVPPAFALVIAWWFPLGGELGVRVAAFAITAAGVGLVVRGIQEKRALFGRPTLAQRFRGWLGRLPVALGRRHAVSANFGVGMEATASAGEATVTVSAGDGATLERRVAVLEQNLERTQAQIRKLGEDLRTQVHAVRGELRTQTEVSRAAVARIQHRIEELAVGGLDLEAVGVCWVLAGALFGTFPQEIATLLVRLLGSRGAA